VLAHERAALACWIALSLVGCGNAGGGGDRGATRTRTRTKAPGPSKAPRPSRPPYRPRCASDIECNVCTTPACECRLQGSPECGAAERPCDVDPCTNVSASCWFGTCYRRGGAAGPCERDEDCEIRADECTCQLFPALRSAPRLELCREHGCAALPGPREWAPRCHATARRCVLERAALPAP